MYKTKMKH